MADRSKAVTKRDEPEMVVVDAVAYVKGSEPLSHAEKDEADRKRKQQQKGQKGRVVRVNHRAVNAEDYERA